MQIIDKLLTFWYITKKHFIMPFCISLFILLFTIYILKINFFFPDKIFILYIGLIFGFLLLFFIILYKDNKNIIRNITKEFSAPIFLMLLILINLYHLNYLNFPKHAISILLILTVGTGILSLYLNYKKIKKNNINNFIFLLFIFLIIIIILYYFYISIHYLGNDEGSFVYDAKLINEGYIPFKDFVTRSPSVLYFYAFLFKFLPISILTLKIVNFLILGITILFLYKILRNIYSKITSILTILIFSSTVYLIMVNFVTSTIILNSLYLVLFVYYYQKYDLKNKKLDIFYSGIFLSLSCLARPISGLIFISVIVFLIFKKKYYKIKYFLYGFIPVPSIIILFISYHIGLKNSLILITGIGSLVTTEAKKSSSYNIWLLDFIGNYYLIIIIIAIIGILYAIIKIKSQKEIFFIWFFSFFLIYSYYLFKRGAGLGYLYEVYIALIFFIALFIEILLLNNKNKIIILILIFIFQGISFFNFVFAGIDNNMYQKLIGSGIKFNDEKIIVNFIKNKTLKESRILAGSLHWAIDSGRRQYSNLSRPLVFEKGSEVSKLYNISRESLIINVEKDPPEIIIKDNRYDLAFYYLSNELFKKYTNNFSLNNIEVWILKP